MDRQEMLKILLLLADGIDPDTGEIYDNDSPYQSPTITRALYQALRELECNGVKPQETSAKDTKDTSQVPPLDAQGQQLLARLHTWRTETAKALSVSAFMVTEV